MTAELFLEAFLLAAQLRHSVYGQYALPRHGSPPGSILLTADKTLADLARKLGVDVSAS